MHFESYEIPLAKVGPTRKVDFIKYKTNYIAYNW